MGWAIVATWAPIAISLVALGVSITVAVQSWRRHPRPRIEAEVGIPHSPVLLATELKVTTDRTSRRVVVANYGNGIAHDVRLTIRRSTREDVRQLGAIPPEGRETARVIVDDDGGKLEAIELSWWQYPARRPRRRSLSIL